MPDEQEREELVPCPKCNTGLSWNGTRCPTCKGYAVVKRDGSPLDSYAEHHPKELK